MLSEYFLIDCFEYLGKWRSGRAWELVGEELERE